MKACIIYNSHTGTTKALAGNIAAFLEEKGLEVMLTSIDRYDRNFVEAADILILGSWTSGLFFIAQGPDRPWKNFAARFPEVKGKKVVFFTTYKLATGSMFRKMERSLVTKTDRPGLIIKSKGPELDEAQKAELDRLC